MSEIEIRNENEFENEIEIELETETETELEIEIERRRKEKKNKPTRRRPQWCSFFPHFFLPQPLACPPAHLQLPQTMTVSHTH